MKKDIEALNEAYEQINDKGSYFDTLPNFAHYAGGLEAAMHNLALNLRLQGLITDEKADAIQAFIDKKVAECKERATK